MTATTATGWPATAAADTPGSPAGGVQPHPAPRPVAPVNTEIAAAHSAAYKTLPQVVVGVDVEDLMKIHTAADADALRPQLVAQVWKDTGVLPTGLPTVRRDVGVPAELPAFTGVRRYDRLEVAMPFGYVATVFVLEPAKSDHRRVAFYHNGHGEPLDTMQRVAQGLLDHGYTVLLFAMPFYHWNPKTLQDPVDPVGHATAVAQRPPAVGVRRVLTARPVPRAPRGGDEPRPGDVPAVVGADGRPVRRWLGDDDLPGARSADHPLLSDRRLAAVLRPARLTEAQPDAG